MAHYPLKKLDSTKDLQKSYLDFKFYNVALNKNISSKVKIGAAKSVSNLVLPANTASNFIYNPLINSSSANLFFQTKKINSESALTAFSSFEGDPLHNLSTKYNKNIEISINSKSFSERSLDTSDTPLLENISNRKDKVESQKVKQDGVFSESPSDNTLLNISDVQNVKHNSFPKSISCSTEDINESSCDCSNKAESANLNQYLLSSTSPNLQKTVEDNQLGDSASNLESKFLYTQTVSL